MARLGAMKNNNLVDELSSAGNQLSPVLRQQILDAGAAAEPQLLAIINDDKLLGKSAFSRDRTLIHAVDLLGAMRSARAIPRLLALLAVSEEIGSLYSHAFRALIAMGEPALEQCLAAYASVDDNWFCHVTLADVLARLNVRDERVYEILVDLLTLVPVRGASALVHYGDPQAISLLHDALESHEFVSSKDNFLANQAVIECAAAIIMLGGELAERERRKCERVIAEQRRLYPNREMSIPSHPHLGTNEPCHCKSGKSYINCHLIMDESVVSLEDDVPAARA